jgi:hypothetical protein
MQSLFPTPYYRLFVVQEGDRDPGSAPADSRQPSAPSPSPSDLAFEAAADQRLINDHTASQGIHDRWAGRGERDRAGEGTGREKDWVGDLIAAVGNEKDPLYCVQASTEDGSLANGIKKWDAEPISTYIELTANLSYPPPAVRGNASETDLPLILFQSKHADSDPQSCDDEKSLPVIQAAYE